MSENIIIIDLAIFLTFSIYYSANDNWRNANGIWMNDKSKNLHRHNILLFYVSQ